MRRREIIAIVWRIVVILAVAILMLPTASADDTVTFTTTANFDAGTKSSSVGNYETETVTDNPGVPADAFELGSVKGDSFTFVDLDADTFKWDLVAFGAPTVNERQIIAGALNIQVTKDAYADAGVASHTSYSGTMDVHVKSHFIVGTAQTHFPWFGLSNEQVADCQATGTVDGIWIRFSTLFLVQTWSCINGALALIGDGTEISPTNDICLRIAGQSGAWTTYYSTSPTCASWTVEESPTTAITGNLFSTMSVGVNVGVSSNAKYQFDDYSVLSGTVNAGGFRATGNWQSAAQIPTVERFDEITVMYSGASASNFITAVSLIDGSGSYVFIDNTDVTSGTSRTYAVGQAEITGLWTVQVNLTGSGSGTVTISEIQVTTIIPVAPVDTCFDANVGGIPVTVLLAVLIGASVVLVIFSALIVRREGLEASQMIGLVVGIVIFVIIVTAFLGVIPPC